MHCVSKIGFQCRHTHTPLTTEMLIHTPANASVFPSSLQTLSNRSCWQWKKPLVRRDRWWAKRYETSKRARENNFIVAAQSRVPAPRFSQFLSLSWLQARGREHQGPLQEQAKTRADWRKCRSAVFLSRCRPRSDNEGLKTVILKFREVFWVRRQWSPNTGMRRISRPPMRFPL